VGEPVGAFEAYRLGLANQVVPDHELFDTALSWARKLSEQAPVAIEQIKQAPAKADLDEGIQAEREAFVTAFTSEDAREGVSAFLQKRRPKFEGK
jgi:enoyl-CoA hydratase / 3-hydroxyacyl-CoA dehydrogenase